MDGITKDRINKLHPKIRQQVLDGVTQCDTAGIHIRVTQGLRTFPEQAGIYAQGRTKPGKVVTNAKAGQSFHNYGLSFDFCLIHEDKSISWSLHEDIDDDGIADWMEVVNIFKKLGFVWGGDWTHKDTPHFEKTFGLTWKDCLALHESGKLDNETYIII